MESEIEAWFANQHILVTGATGFMGKILVEKLLRSCPSISTIYLLVRNKRGKNRDQRLEDFLNSPIFDQLRDSPNKQRLFSKLKCITGDIEYENCQLSNQDLQALQSNITTVFHMAANVRFDQDLKSALTHNTGGTKNVLDMVCSFNKLKAFIHVSTSYCHCQETIVEERLYPAPHDPLKMLDLVKWMPQELLKIMTPKLLNGSPNTYAYTKCLTEELVSRYAHKIPVAIARPSIVTAVWKEPIPGWIDNLNGPTGILVGAGKGVIRSMHCNPDLVADLVPVDVAINSLIVIACNLGKSIKSSEPTVFNITGDKDSHIKWGDALEMGKRHLFKYPFSVCLWYPGGSIKTNYFIHMLSVFFFHLIPAYLVDFMMIVLRKKPFLVRTQQKINNGLTVLQYYTTRPWQFHNEKLNGLYEKLGKVDREVFYTSNGELNMEEYILNYILGARKFCVHEEPETIPYARKVLNRLYYIDLITNVMIYMFLVWLFFIYSGFMGSKY